MNATGFGASLMPRFESGSDALRSWRVRGINCEPGAFDIPATAMSTISEVVYKDSEDNPLDGKGTAIHLPMFTDKSRLSRSKLSYISCARARARAIVVCTLDGGRLNLSFDRLALSPRGNPRVFRLLYGSCPMR